MPALGIGAVAAAAEPTGIAAMSPEVGAIGGTSSRRLSLGAAAVAAAAKAAAAASCMHTMHNGSQVSVFLPMKGLIGAGCSVVQQLMTEEARRAEVQ